MNKHDYGKPSLPKAYRLVPVQAASNIIELEIVGSVLEMYGRLTKIIWSVLEMYGRVLESYGWVALGKFQFSLTNFLTSELAS